MATVYPDNEGSTPPEETYSSEPGNSSAEHQDAAVRYIRKGLRPIPVKGKNRPPDGWPALKITEDEALGFWGNGHKNVALINDRWCAVDNDCPESVTLAGRFLVPTLTSGHGDRLDLHWWYEVAGGGWYKKFTDLDGTTTLVEFRGDGGHYTLVAPSLHPNGERYRWSRSGLEIARVGLEEMKRRVRLLATAVLVARHLPEHRGRGGGGRHDFALALAGFLLRAGRLDEADTLAVCKAAWDAKGYPSERDGREAHKDLDGAVRDTARKLVDDDKVKGGRELNKMVPGLTSKISDYWEWSEKNEQSKEAKKVGETKLLADAICEDNHFAQDAGGKLYRFVDGAYRLYAERFIKRRVKELLEEWEDTARWSSHRASEVAEYIKADAPLLWEKPPTDEVNVLNGILDVWMKALRPHSPDWLSTVQLPVSYDEDAACPEWVKFVKSTFPEDAQRLAFEIVADLMTPERSEQKSILAIGEGSNGKSTYLSALATFVGTTNIVGLSLQKVESDRFSAARLVGKLANICPDLPSSHLVGTSMFKAVTGGDIINAEYKYKESFEFRPYARLIFSANHVPRSEDASHAFFRRWLVVPFDKTFEGREAVPREELDAKLSDPKELSGVLNKALEVLPDLRKNGFTESESMRKAWAEFREMTDPVSVWLDKATVEHPDAYVAKSALHGAYNAHCEQKGQAGMTTNAFGRAVHRVRPRLSEAQRTWDGVPKVKCWLGIGLKTDDDPRPRPSPDSPDSPDSTNCFLNEGWGSSGGADADGGSEITNRENRVNAVNAVNRRLTEDEARKVRKLIDEGMSPALARASVLGEVDALFDGGGE